MSRSITVGFDRSPESRAAVRWAADEAVARGLPVHAVYAWEWQPRRLALTDARTERARVEATPRTAAALLRAEHPGLRVHSEMVTGPPVPVLLAAARDAELLVLGSRAIGGVHGFLVGSVAQSVVARGERPVVLVRPDSPQGPGEAARHGPVVLGLGAEFPGNDVVAFAFEEAAYRSAPLHVVAVGRGAAATTSIPDADARHAREEADRLTVALAPWRHRYPGVPVTARCLDGDPGEELVRAARDASLLVVGRRSGSRMAPPRTGHATHVVMHRCPVPVAVVP
ncbi:universal stress protein [Streptomyces sp. NPDC050560]|uniref:universal stress protein n=1 Tax=Streptomyces sp. NPDC050560 TaxID=3365630 RepID=UPI0037979470